MSQATQASTGRDTEETVTESDRVQEILDALDDPDCQTILDATGDEPLTAHEISDACDLPLSTAYRKIDVLADTPLLEERTRIRESGGHSSEYARLVEEVHISVDGGDGLSLEITQRASRRSLSSLRS